MKNASLIFELNGYPSIKIYGDFFEIKAIDFSKLRKFNYSSIHKIKHFNPNNNWWTKIYILGSISAQIFANDDPWILRIEKKNGGSWDYQTSPKTNSEFNQVIDLIKLKVYKESE